MFYHINSKIVVLKKKKVITLFFVKYSLFRCFGVTYKTTSSSFQTFYQKYMRGGAFESLWAIFSQNKKSSWQWGLLHSKLFRFFLFYKAKHLLKCWTVINQSKTQKFLKISAYDFICYFANSYVFEMKITGVMYQRKKLYCILLRFQLKLNPRA